MFSNALFGLAEIEQDRPTLLGGKHDWIISFAKLPSAVLLDLQSADHAKWVFGHRLGESSDHVLVLLLLGLLKGGTWLAASLGRCSP